MQHDLMVPGGVFFWVFGLHTSGANIGVLDGIQLNLSKSNLPGGPKNWILRYIRLSRLF